MKKLAVFFALIFLSVFSAAAENSAQLKSEDVIQNEQLVVLPKSVYVGDETEIRYSFTSPIELEADLELPCEVDYPSTEEYSILSATLAQADSSRNNGYVLVVHLVPWKAGFIDLPSITLTDLFVIDIAPVVIESIVEHTGHTELRKVRPPVIIPGTTGLLFFVLAVAVIFIVALIILLHHIHKTGKTFLGYFASLIFSTGFRKALRSLKKLIKKDAELSDEVFAARFSAIMRTWLTARFNRNFAVLTTSEFQDVYQDISAGLFSAEFTENFNTIVTSLTRLDYIRYSDAQGKENRLSAEERTKLVSDVRKAVLFLEKGWKAQTESRNEVKTDV